MPSLVLRPQPRGGRARVGGHVLSLLPPVSLPCFVLPVARQGALFRNTNVQIQ